MCLRCPQCGTATTKEVDRTQFLLDIIIWAWPHPCLCWALISLSRISLPSPPLSSYHFIIQLRLGLPGKITNSVLLWFLKDFHSTWSKRKIELTTTKKLRKIRLRQTWTFAVHCGASLSMKSAPVQLSTGRPPPSERPFSLNVAGKSLWSSLELVQEKGTDVYLSFNPFDKVCHVAVNSRPQDFGKADGAPWS